jgi:hypothetical protein
VPRPLPRFNPVERVKDAEQLARVMREVDVAQSDPRPVNGAGGELAPADSEACPWLECRARVARVRAPTRCVR